MFASNTTTSHGKDLDDVISILLVDDNVADLELVNDYLSNDSEQRFTATFALSGEEALQLANDKIFDCVLVDYRMPGINGLEVLSRLREKRSTQEVPVIVLTGVGTENTVVESLRAGAADYLSKETLAPAPIKRAIVNAVEQARLRTQLLRRTESLEAANIELQQRHAEIQRVYHTMSHEIKTPICAAREFASLLKDEIPGPLGVEQKECVVQIVDCCDQLTLHFNDLLDFARANVGKMSLQLDEQDIGPLIRRSVAANSALARNKRISIIRTIDSDLPTLPVDGNRFVQLLSNLLNNAIKFTDNGGKVELLAQTVKSPAEGLQVSVIDTGCGISAEDLGRVFESLYQASNNSTETHAGLGLGLCIARDIARLHGGDISASSKLEVGTTFTVFIPFSPAVGSHNTKHAVPIAEGVE